jgi:hypothetical protein
MAASASSRLGVLPLEGGFGFAGFFGKAGSCSPKNVSGYPALHGKCRYRQAGAFGSLVFAPPKRI